MECRGVVCSFDLGSGELTVYSATQGVHIARTGFATQLDMPLEKVRVLAGDIGGSFGLKLGAAREDIACAAASRRLGRPIRWIEDRSENLTASGQARDESFEVEAAISNEGHILGLRVKMIIDTGAYPGLGGMLPEAVKGMIPGPYKIGALSFESTAVITNKASYVAYRGPWASETWVRERMIDLIAKELAMEPLEVRLRNVVTRGEPPLQMLTGRSLVGVTSRESLDRIAALVDVEAFRRRQAEARAQGRYLGLGLATYIEAAPGPRTPGGGGGICLLYTSLARPSHLVDLAGISELGSIVVDDGHLVIGAMVRERAAERHDDVRLLAPLLAQALPLIGHPAIRSRGTIGGSLAHADPAAELPAVALLLDAELVAQSRDRGKRTIKAADFFSGFFTTALQPDEILTEVRIRRPALRTGSAIEVVRCV